jgi:hypothetical protein
VQSCTFQQKTGRRQRQGQHHDRTGQPGALASPIGTAATATAIATTIS